MTTGKSRHRREVIIPLYDELRWLLALIPKRATTVLTSTRHRPWTASGLFDRRAAGEGCRWLG
jgi:hypothetical protein